MVIGWRRGEGEKPWSAGVGAWAQVEAAQRAVRLPCLLIPQPAHAVLAGELAAGLLAASFGELPAEITRAIQMHDTGWAASDAQQIQRLRSGPQTGALPVSFVAIPASEAVEAWTASIDSIESWSKRGAIVVSRHFCLLARHDQPAHRRFLQAEEVRQGRLAAEAPAAAGDLERWTAALGFCDLVSLYLLTGLSGPVEFPLAHPSSAPAQTAPRVTMQIEGARLRFTPAALQAGCTLSIQALNHPVPRQGTRTESLTWEVA